jgi:hypothetical protein
MVHHDDTPPQYIAVMQVFRRWHSAAVAVPFCYIPGAGAVLCSAVHLAAMNPLDIRYAIRSLKLSYRASTAKFGTSRCTAASIMYAPSLLPAAGLAACIAGVPSAVTHCFRCQL